MESGSVGLRLYWVFWLSSIPNKGPQKVVGHYKTLVFWGLFSFNHCGISTVQRHKKHVDSMNLFKWVRSKEQKKNICWGKTTLVQWLKFAARHISYKHNKYLTSNVDKTYTNTPCSLLLSRNDHSWFKKSPKRNNVNVMSAAIRTQTAQLNLNHVEFNQFY